MTRRQKRQSVAMVLTRAAVTGLLVATLCLLATGAVWAIRAGEEDRVVTPVPVRTPVEVVNDWDAQRSAAWSNADVEALDHLYAPGAAVGRKDAGMLDAYVERGLRVQGLKTQLLAVEQIRVDEEMMVLRVTDRLHAGTVVGPGVEQALPGDGVSTRRVTFRRFDGAWRVARVIEISGGQAG